MQLCDSARARLGLMLMLPMLMHMLMISVVMEMDDLTDSDDCHSTAAAPLLLFSCLLYYSSLISSSLFSSLISSAFLLSLISSYQSSMLTFPFHQSFIISSIVSSSPCLPYSPLTLASYPFAIFLSVLKFILAS